MGTGHQLKYKWTAFASDALLTAVTKRITNSNLLMNRLVEWNIILNISRYKVRVFWGQEPTWNHIFLFYSKQVSVSCENLSQFPHFLKVPVITAVSQMVWKGTQSFRGLRSRDLTISEDSDVPRRPRSLSPSGVDVSQDFHLPAPPPPVLPIKVCVLILALFCNTHGHESALLRIALVQPLRSRECRLINKTALLTPGLVAGKTDANHRNLSGLFFSAVPVVMVLLLACLILSSKWFFFKDGRREMGGGSAFHLMFWSGIDLEKSGIIGLLSAVRCGRSLNSAVKNCSFHCAAELLVNSSV